MRERTFYLRTARKQARLTQKQLGDRAGITQKQVCELETNPKVRPLFATVVAIAEVLHLKPTQLRFGPVPTRKEAVA
jgi:transcriptional regulator with XRE-family HTH domain